MFAACCQVHGQTFSDGILVTVKKYTKKTSACMLSRADQMREGEYT